MRVLSFNIQGGVRGIDAVAGALRDLAPDVACLNEVRGSHRRRIAAITGRHTLFGPTIGFRRFGNMIISREPIEPVAQIRLSASPGMERRGLVIARTGDVIVAATHLGLAGEERLRHVEEILAALDGFPSVIVGGDFNEEPAGPALARLEGRLTDSFFAGGQGDGNTFPSNGPRRRIDYIFVRGYDVESCEAVATVVSDHLPVVAVLDV